jgi:hypothetical protein
MRERVRLLWLRLLWLRDPTRMKEARNHYLQIPVGVRSRYAVVGICINLRSVPTVLTLHPIECLERLELTIISSIRQVQPRASHEHVGADGEQSGLDGHCG